MNVLVYNGRGVSSESLHHTLHSLRRAIGHHYDIRLVTAHTLAHDPWEEGCRLLLIPGGRDLPYVHDLSGPATRRIQSYLRDHGGRVLGICAGAYLCCDRVEFERGTSLEVVGERELRLCAATATGSVYPGFEYGGEAGAHAVSLELDGRLRARKLEDVRIYFNGGCFFDFSNARDAALSLEYHTLARYRERDNLPAIVAGYAPGQTVSPSVVLSGVHIEYDVAAMAERQPGHPLLSTLEPHREGQRRLWNEILCMLGLSVAAETPLGPGPNSTPIYMFFPESRRRTAFLTTLKACEHYRDGLLFCERIGIRVIEDGDNLHRHDAHLKVSEAVYPLVMAPSIAALKEEHWTFSPDQYYLNLSRLPLTKGVEYIGRHLLYAEYIPSTQTILSQ